MTPKGSLNGRLPFRPFCFAVNERNTCNEKEEGLHPLAFIPANVRLSVSLDRGSEAGMQ